VAQTATIHTPVLCNKQGRTVQSRDVPRGQQCPKRRKVPAMSQVLSSVLYICFRNTLRSNMGAPNRFLPRASSYLCTPLGMRRLRWRSNFTAFSKRGRNTVLHICYRKSQANVVFVKIWLLFRFSAPSSTCLSSVCGI